MGLTPHEYYCMSPLEFYYASKGYMNKYYKELEQTRIIAYTVASTVPSKKKLPSMYDQKSTPIPEFLGMAKGIFCLPLRQFFFLYFFDLCLHCVSVVREFDHLQFPLFFLNEF